MQWKKCLDFWKMKNIMEFYGMTKEIYVIMWQMTDGTNGINFWLIWKRLYRVTPYRDYSFMDRRARAGGRIRFYSLFATMQVSAYASPSACVSWSWNCNLIACFSNELIRSKYLIFWTLTYRNGPFTVLIAILSSLLTTTFRASFIVLRLHIYIYCTLFHEES